MRIFKTRTEEEMEHDEHNYTAEMQCNLECESTKILLCLGSLKCHPKKIVAAKALHHLIAFCVPKRTRNPVDGNLG